MVTSFKMPHAPTAAFSAPTLQQASASPRLHQRLLDTHGQIGSVSCGVAPPLSWALVHTRFCFCLLRVCLPILCKFWWLYGVFMVTSSKRAYAIPKSAALRVSATAAGHCRLVAPEQTLKNSSGSISVGSLGPGMHKVCMSPPSISSGYGV